MRRIYVGVLVVAASLFPSRTASAQDQGCGQVSGDEVNVRAGPGTNYPLVCQLERGARVSLRGKTGEWWHVGLVGRDVRVHVSRRFVDLRSGVGVANADRVNVRLEPSLEGLILGRLDRGDLVRVLAVRDEWVEIALPDRIDLYVQERFIEPLPGGAESAGTEETPCERGPAAPASAAPRAGAPAEPANPHRLLAEQALAAFRAAVRMPLETMDFTEARRLAEGASVDEAPPAAQAMAREILQRIAAAEHVRDAYLQEIERLNTSRSDAGR